MSRDPKTASTSFWPSNRFDFLRIGVVLHVIPPDMEIAWTARCEHLD
jgi:hypothetical protein